jgi:hypothetical protein
VNALEEMRFRNLFGNTPQKDALTRSMDDSVLGRRGLMNSPEINPTVSPLNAPDTDLPLIRRATPDLDQYRSYLDKAPNREDYKMGKWGTALAAISGIASSYNNGSDAGISQFKGLKDFKFNEASRDYERKGASLKEKAELERMSMTDEEKRDFAIRELALKQRKEFTDELKTASGIKMDNAQIANLQSQMAARGLSTQKNESTGQLEVIDSINRTRTPMGKFFNTLDDQTKSDFGLFQKKEAVTQAGKLALQNDAQAHDVNMAGVRFDNDKKLAAFKKELDTNAKNYSPEQKNAAFNGAYAETMAMYPEMRDHLFDPSEDGKNVTLKKDYNPVLFDMFKRIVEEKNREKLGQPNTLVNNPHQGTGRLPGIPEAGVSSNNPAVQDPANIALRQAAVQYIKDHSDDPDVANNEDAIAETMAFLQAQVPQNQPQVTLPQAQPAQAPLIPVQQSPQGIMNNRPVPTKPYVAGNPNPFSAMWNGLASLNPASRDKRGY